VESTRGASGGVALARPAREITLRQIVEATEGPMAINRCLLKKGRCKHANTCAVAPVWRQAQDAMLAVLSDVTLAKLNGKHKS
jgi:Rrf2 family protein